MDAMEKLAAGSMLPRLLCPKCLLLPTFPSRPWTRWKSWQQEACCHDCFVQSVSCCQLFHRVHGRDGKVGSKKHVATTALSKVFPAANFSIASMDAMEKLAARSMLPQLLCPKCFL